MKKLFISMLAIAALASCAKEETLVADQGELIGFNSFVENATRVEDPSYNAENLDQFNVYGTVNGITIFDDVLVEGEVGADVWSYEGNTQYWIKGATYNFAAVVDVPKENITFDNGLPTSISYTANDTTDILYAEAKGINGTDPGNNGVVNFVFSHLLSKVEFSAAGQKISGQVPAGYTYEISDIVIKNAKKVGSVAVPSRDWTISDDASNKKTVVGFGIISGAFNEVAAECENAKLLIPATYSNETAKLEISFVVTTKFNGGTIQVDEYTGAEGKLPTFLVDVDFKPGYSYNFKFAPSVGMPINFSVTSEPTWTSTSVNVQ